MKKHKQLKDELLLHLNTQLPTKPKDPIFHAFNNEYKCRWYVQSICEFVIKSYKKQYYLEMERKIPIFGYSKEMQGGKLSKQFNKLQRPDFEIMNSDSGDSSCIIEVKKLVVMPWSGKHRQSKHREPQFLDVKDYLTQQMKQLRSYCIKEKKDSMVGVITNSRDWIFTRYDMQAEFKIGEDRFKQQTDKNRNHEFEYSTTFKIFEINEENG